MAKTSKSNGKVTNGAKPATWDEWMTAQRSEIPEPQKVPTGTWTLTVKAAKSVESDGTDGLMGKVRFVFNPAEPGDDVDTDAIADGSYKGEAIFFNFRIQKPSDFEAVHVLLDKMGVDEGELKVRLAAAQKEHSAIIASVGLRSWTDEATGVNRSDNTLKNFVPVV